MSYTRDTSLPRHSETGLLGDCDVAELFQGGRVFRALKLQILLLTSSGPHCMIPEPIHFVCCDGAKADNAP